MILDYYKLREQPFGVTPDPRFWYASETHREAFASLIYALESGRGFVALIAKPGMGKTTLVHHGLQRIRDMAKTVYLYQSIQTPEHLLEAILTDLRVEEPRGSLIELQAKFNNVCATHCIAGKGIVLVVDEAQNLPDQVLEFLRMLSNFETTREKLIQIVVAGQPQLAEKLASPNMVQLRQRISAFASLRPLSPADARTYVEHRLKVAGYSSDVPLFTRYALDLIATHSEGIPRNISNLCFNAMSIGCALRRKSIDTDIIQEVISDLSLDPLREYTAASKRPVFQEEPVALAMSQLNRTAAVAVEPAIYEVRTAPASGASSGAAAGNLHPPDQNRWVSPLFATPRAPRTNSFKLFSRTWAFATAGVSLFLLLAVLGLIPGFRREIQVVAAKADVGLRSLIPGDSPAPTPSPTAQAGSEIDRVNLYSAREGQSLQSICAASFGKCTPQILREIRRLNPQLGHPVHIFGGQLIRIPDKDTLTAAAEQADRSSPTRRNAP